MYLFSDLEIDLKETFKIFCVNWQTQKYTWTVLSRLMFFFKLRSILKADFLNLCIYTQSQEVYLK